MAAKKHVLLAVSGTSPAVITEIFYHLSVTQKLPVTRIVVITTSPGKAAIQRQLLETRPGDERPVFEQLCTDYKLKRSGIQFDADSIIIARDDEDMLLQDVRDNKDQQFFPNLIMTTVRKLTAAENSIVHACISGGRKSMSFYLGVAMMLYARPEDEILHVLVDRPYEVCRPVFYYPLPHSREASWEQHGEEKKIDLKEGQLYVSRIPFVRLRRTFAEKGDLSYQALIKLYQRDIDELPALEEKHYPGLLPRSGVMRDIMRKCQTLLKDELILLMGESGTGKGALAEFIHNSKTGTDKQFFSVNLAAETDQLVNTRLFGFVKGAFTGADRDQISVFEKAGDGTVFLDEIDKTSMNLQKKLLRLLEKREYVPEGSLEVKSFRCRIIIASGRDLQQLVDEKTFYPDLYYRVERFLFMVPPLRERLVDIMPLAHYFLLHANEKYGKKFEEFDERLEHYLVDHQWPNNVRQLENQIHRLVAFNDGKVLQYDFLEEKSKKEPQAGLNRYDRMQREIIEQILVDCDGNVAEAAKLLELKYNTLRSKISRLQIDKAHFRRVK